MVRGWGAAWLCALLLAAAVPGGALRAQSPSGPGGEYLDDRSSASQLVRSYFNAINRHEYARAHSYWEPGAAASQLPPFEEFAGGYADTAWVDVILGEVQGDVGTGQLYWSVPVGIVAGAADGTITSFAGCYRAHLGRPQLQAVPPFHPMGFLSATVQEVGDDQDLAQAMVGVCAPA